MDWIITKNNRSINLKEVPVLEIAAFRKAIIKECSFDKRVIGFFGMQEGKDVRVTAVLADDENSRLLLSSALFGKKRSYSSITPEIPAFHLFERELYEQTGILPEGHPWLKPVRYPHESAPMTDYPFFRMEGEEIHEVAVGPIHAGVIEPGHFRFQCHGENVYHLEIQLGYQHRGLEKMFVQEAPFKHPYIAESIAGDTVLGHSIAFANAMESLGRVKVTKRSLTVRAVMLELERIAVHIGDLGALSGDIAFQMGNAVYGATRTLVINTSMAICGSRFGRGMVRPGGSLYDIDRTTAELIRKNLAAIEHKVNIMNEALFSNSSVLTRFEQTGIVNREDAAKIGMVGPAARASGVSVDVRVDHPGGVYRTYPIHKITLDTGDVFARAYIRTVEINQSIRFIYELLDNMPPEELLLTPVGKLLPDQMVVSLVEGWRGEIAHTAVTDQKGAVRHYKIKDPSFNNWYGLALAVRNNGISDFPLCNKSFNLSYCGFDL